MNGDNVKYRPRTNTALVFVQVYAAATIHLSPNQKWQKLREEEGYILLCNKTVTIRLSEIEVKRYFKEVAP